MVCEHFKLVYEGFVFCGVFFPCSLNPRIDFLGLPTHGGHRPRDTALGAGTACGSAL